jgi:hypothetical protein
MMPMRHYPIMHITALAAPTTLSEYGMRSMMLRGGFLVRLEEISAIALHVPR